MARHNKRWGIESNKTIKETCPDQIPIEIIKLIYKGQIGIRVDPHTQYTV